MIKGGYTGKILCINLRAQTSSVINTNAQDAKNFIGAKGLGAKILYDRLPRGVDPLSPHNILMFTTGPLTGTPVQTSGRGAVVTKSPLTNLYLDSHFGGFFAVEMKKAGWDIIILEERSEKPIYVFIQDDSVTFENASQIWGEECLKTHNWLLKNKGKVRTAVIGPAGENLVKFSCITIDGHRHAGRGGSGAVMGSKNLKAIAIRGSEEIELYEEEAFKDKAQEVLQKIKDHPFIPFRRKYGTPYWVKPINDWGFIPTMNYREGRFEYADNINADTMQERIVDNKGACFNCIIRCWNKSSVKSGPYRGISLVGPEYETLALMGANLGTKTVEEVAYLNERCNELGMDTISCGGVLGFAIEAKNLEWGKTEELAKLLKKIAYREGEGDILAEGVFRASKKIGSEKYAVHVKGMELPGYDPRGAFGIGLAYATSDRGACHQRAWTARPEVMDPELERFSFKKKAKLVKDIQDERAAFFSLVLCDFAPISVEDCVVLLNLATGFRYSKESYLLSGERIWNLIRVFNLREGVEEDTLPWRIFNDPFTKGPAKNKVIPHKEFKECLEEYYSLRGWNKKGVPTKEKLKQLGLVGCD